MSYVPLIAFSLVSSSGWKVAFFLPLQQDLAKVSSPKTTINSFRNATFQPMDGFVDIISTIIVCSQVRSGIPVSLGVVHDSFSRAAILSSSFATLCFNSSSSCIKYAGSALGGMVSYTGGIQEGSCG